MGCRRWWALKDALHAEYEREMITERVNVGIAAARANGTRAGRPLVNPAVIAGVRYQSQMAAVEYGIEHDDGQSLRALERAELILIAPSRCGKNANHHAIGAAARHPGRELPLVEEDFDTMALPNPCCPSRTSVSGSHPNLSGSAGSGRNAARAATTHH